ncbi:hypothetical protein Bca52824_084597 [Brassica carinata]|uniref:C2H2-type domain-containing protein n=1 Tax=Brassica carinata TaxID=52824 RepID=A0A8X7TUX8_BRACI|nr:hypothetical protein Bca52824_084597 [Brassica carinata]
MSSPHNNTDISFSTQSSLPNGATTGANNLNREETARTSTQQPNSVADPLHHNPDAEVIALRPRTFIETGIFVCELCGKRFTREQTRDLHRRGHDLPWTLPN